jgi:hypothetical protein
VLPKRFALKPIGLEIVDILQKVVSEKTRKESENGSKDSQDSRYR